MTLAACSDRLDRLDAPPAVPTDPATFDTAGIDQAMQGVLSAGAPAVLVEVRRGGEVWRQSLGVSDVTATGRPDPLAAVRVASITKSMLGATLLQLVAEGRLDLDAPLSRYLPGFNTPTASPAATSSTASPAPPSSATTSPPPDGGSWATPGLADVITPRMLAQHTAGLPDYIQTFPLADLTRLRQTLTASYAVRDLIARAEALPLTNTPGAEFHYSNTNYLVLSMLVEAITGEPIGEVFQERIVRQGALAATSLPRDDAMPEGAARGYVVLDNVYLDVTVQSGSLWSGAGGVVSTVGDVNSFYRGLLQGAYVPDEELATMLELNEAGYGIGVQGHVDPCPVPTASPTPTSPVAGAPSASAAPSSSTSASPSTSPTPGEPGMTYGHMGSGLGYRMLSFSSPDGERQVTVSWTASPTDYAADPRLGPAWAVVDAALTATCASA